MEPDADPGALYERALAMIVADLGDSPVDPVVGVDINDDELTYTYRSREGRSQRTNIPLQGDVASAAALLAGLVQDDVLDDLRGVPWPECPGHPHPASPAVLGTRAVWVCPRTDAAIADIGSLTAGER